MDKGSRSGSGSVNKKQSPGSVSRRAYSIFGGIINLTQSSGGAKSTALSGSPTGGRGGDAGNVVSSGTSQNLQGSSNVYTVTVTNTQNPQLINPSQAKTCENGMKKKKGAQSSSGISSVSNSVGMSSSSSGGGSGNNNNNNNSKNNGGNSSSSTNGPIGPAPRTISILTALNELATSDERRPNPPSSTLTSPPQQSTRDGGGDNIISKSNPIHSSFQHPPFRRHSSTAKAQVADGTNLSLPNSRPSPSSSTIVYHSNGGRGGSEHQQQQHHHHQQQHRNAIPFVSSPSRTNATLNNVNTLPSKLRLGNKSLGGHKETLTRKGTGRQQRDRSKSRTPDWIWKIFQLTKLGKLEELQGALQGLDPTLIRHLTDARGNTLLHSTVRAGHVHVLKWLVSVLGQQCSEAALNDQNQAGRTVILTALKKGQLQCVQWLVNHTKCGEKALVPNEGERSLLHFASTFGDVNNVRFLCSQLIDKGLSVDIRDASGMTPLHDAARAGDVAVCHELILAGADPLSQTELGWRPSDLAIRHRHMECASYFMVAEAAGSLGNQLHSLLLAFNHLRQEHEELRAHFRETLRVGKWLAKERNDLIKHFTSNWSPEGGSSGTGSTTDASTMLLGGQNNGTRFSDMEHKLVLAEQCWKKLISRNADDSQNDFFLNGSEEDQNHAQLSNISSQDLLHRRLAALQLRLERNQSLGTSLSGSSDEDPHPYMENSSSSEDGSSSDLDVERIATIAAGSSNLILSTPPSFPSSSSTSSSSATTTFSSSALLGLSSTLSPPFPEKNRVVMKTRSKAAPWLLPPNDVFLSQLSPFVGSANQTPSATLGKGLPTLDLLHGAPTTSSSASLMSPIVAPTSTSTVATTEAAEKNEKSLVQRDAERQGSHGGKRDSTALDISVLEVIEPTSHASPSSTSNKKGEDGVERFQVSEASRSQPRPWLDLSVHHYENQKEARGVLRSLPKREMMLKTKPEIGGEEGNSTGGGVVGGAGSSHDGGGGHGLDGVAKGVLGRKMMSTFSLSASSSSSPAGEAAAESGAYSGRERRPSPSRLRPGILQENEDQMQMLPKNSVHQAPDLLCGMQYGMLEGRRRKSRTSSLIDRHNHEEDFCCETRSSREKMIMERGEDQNEQTGVTRENDIQRNVSVCSADELSRLDLSTFQATKEELLSQRKASTSLGMHESRTTISRQRFVSGPSSSQSLSQSSSIPSPLQKEGSLSCSFDIGKPGGRSGTEIDENGAKGFSKTRSPSPKSYVTKLTVIPVETTETCFLSLKSTSFVHEEHDKEDPHLPGENQDDIALSQIPCDSVSSTNTPVMPRFNSSGSVVFPPKKHEWNSSELLSLTTPDSSLAGRLSPTPSETSRTESALAPPPSYISHASQNSELSKTESQRGGHTFSEGDLQNSNSGGNHGSTEDPGLGSSSSSSSRGECISGESLSHPFRFLPSAYPSNPSQPTNITGTTSPPRNNDDNNEESKCTGSVGGIQDPKNPCGTRTSHSSSSSSSTSHKDSGDYLRGTCRKKDDDDVHDPDSGDNDGSKRKLLPSTTPFGKQRFQAAPFFFRTPAGGSHKPAHQRLPKAYRGHCRPWYEIEGSDDEGSLLRKARSSHPRSTSSSSSPTEDNPESSSHDAETEGNETEDEDCANDKGNLGAAAAPHHGRRDKNREDDPSTTSQTQQKQEKKGKEDEQEYEDETPQFL